MQSLMLFGIYSHSTKQSLVKLACEIETLFLKGLQEMLSPHIFPPPIPHMTTADFWAFESIPTSSADCLMNHAQYAGHICRQYKSIASVILDVGLRP